MEKPLGKRTKSSPSGQDIADWLRERIRKGRFVPGQRLVEIDIIESTGGSRAKVREAFQRLEAERLVVIEEFRGASVRKASMREIREIYRLRVALEGQCAADFASDGTAKDKARLRELQRELDACVNDNASERFARLNGEWHDHVIKGAKNRLIRDVLARLTVPINRLLFESFYDTRWLRKANIDHQGITHAILAGDSAKAGALMRRHIEDGEKTLSTIASEFSE
ncbi:GntR family transcriptional regulator [Pelagerythrobacter marensis]|uniref:GntR family transcriptional regulator n=1 Tax=Pelagerythrobacter marensis TaxID=543877 RepID=A0ABZ2D3S1_9SPHN